MLRYHHRRPAFFPAEDAESSRSQSMGTAATGASQAAEAGDTACVGFDGVVLQVAARVADSSGLLLLLDAAVKYIIMR
jgi:hypothetical protein